MPPSFVLKRDINHEDRIWQFQKRVEARPRTGAARS